MDLDIQSHLQSIEDIVSSITYEPPDTRRDMFLEEVDDVVKDMSKQNKERDLKVSKLQADCKAAKDKLAYLDKQRTTTKKELSKLKEEYETITKKLKKLNSGIQECNAKINQANRKSVTEKDYELLDKNKKELYAYKALTGIRWNFNVPENIKEGIITNSQNNFVKTFQFEKNQPKKKITKTLWTYISESGTDQWVNCDDNKLTQ